MPGWPAFSTNNPRAWALELPYSEDPSLTGETCRAICSLIGCARPSILHPAALLALSVALLAGCGSGTENPSAAQSPPVPNRDRDGAPRRASNRDRDRSAAPRITPKRERPPAETPRRASNQNVEPRRSQETPSPAAQPVYRDSDRRPRHDDRRLSAVGIRAFASKRLKLYTDVDPDVAEKLPPLIDAAYPAWEDYFGKLPPNREGTPFQITGYLMADEDRFRTAGLIPDDLQPFEAGRHRGAEFWLYEQEYEYYRRHLLIHEATHCFLQAMAGPRYFEQLPPWYWEGMAEYFGTHFIRDDGTVEFGVMPGRHDEFVGFGRIAMIRRACRRGKFRPIRKLIRLRGEDYMENESYAWSWALCKFLDSHPRYREGFRELRRLLTGKQFAKAFRGFLNEEGLELRTEWRLFAHNLQYGYDVKRAAVEFRDGRALDAENAVPVAVEIAADRGWQSAAVRVEKGSTYRATATGRFVLAAEPKPWVSEPQGISFDYFGGRPLGTVLAAVRAENPQTAAERNSMLNVIAVGRGGDFVAPYSGTLYFRVNDSWSRLSDNSGTVQVEISRAK